MLIKSSRPSPKLKALQDERDAMHGLILGGCYTYKAEVYY